MNNLDLNQIMLAVSVFSWWAALGIAIEVLSRSRRQ